jgi:hypothetical protein
VDGEYKIYTAAMKQKYSKIVRFTVATLGLGREGCTWSDPLA